MTPLLILLLLVGGVVLLSSTDGVSEGVRGAVVGGNAPSTKDRRLAERAPGGGVAAAALHASASLRDRYGSGLGGKDEKDSPVGREERGLSGRLRQEAEERQAVAYLRDVSGMAQQHPRRGAAGTKPGAGSASKPSLQAGDAASARGVLAPRSSPPPRARYHWPPLPPSPPPPPPPAADPVPGTYKFVRPNCADRVDQCKLWREYGECRCAGWWQDAVAGRLPPAFNSCSEGKSTIAALPPGTIPDTCTTTAAAPAPCAT